MKISKFIAVVLSVIIIFSISTVSFAEDAETLNAFAADQTEENVEATEETPQAPETTEDPVEGPEKQIDPNQPLVTMYLCATARTFTGHVWLYFDNFSEVTVDIGYVRLEPGKQTSVGSLRNTRKDGGGTYYNGEAFMARNLETTGNHTTYLKMDLNLNQLNKISEEIKSRNFYNIIVWNCGNFAAAIWNSVSSHKIIHITFPIFTILEMNMHGAKKGLVMTRPDIENVYKQVKGGVKQARAESFETCCV